MILTNKKDQKYIINRTTGLSQLFATLANTINQFVLLNLDLNNLYFTHGAKNPKDVGVNVYLGPYEDLNAFFDFKTIHYISYENYLTNKEDFILLPDQSFSAHCNMNWGTKYHLSNFVKYKNFIMQEALLYASPIGMHFRLSKEEDYFMYTRRKIQEKNVLNSINLEREAQFNSYTKKFLERNVEEIECFCACDSSQMSTYLSNFKNVKLRNIHRQQNNAIDRSNTKETVLDLCCLSLCDFVYSTSGQFANLALALKPGIQQNPFEYEIQRLKYQGNL